MTDLLGLALNPDLFYLVFGAYVLLIVGMIVKMFRWAYQQDKRDRAARIKKHEDNQRMFLDD